MFLASGESRNESIMCSADASSCKLRGTSNIKFHSDLLILCNIESIE